MKLRISIIFTTFLAAACSDEPVATPAGDLGTLAAEYLFLELSMGNIDSGHVDAYFGPAEIKTQADEAELSLDEISERAAAMDDVLRAVQKPYDHAPALVDESAILMRPGRIAWFAVI